MLKNKAIGITGVGVVLIIASLASLRFSEINQWFPVLLLFGAAITWTGVSRYRAV